MGLLPLWGMWRAPGSFSEVSHQATTVFSRIWQIHFSWGIFGKIESSFCEENTSDEMKEHLSEERWGSFSDICLILISPPISLQSLQSSSFISVAQLGGRWRFTLFAGIILLSHFSFLSPQSSEMRAGALSACSHPAVVHHHGSTGFLGLFGLA